MRDVHVFRGRGCLVYPDGSREPVSDWVDNVLMDEGEASIINVYLRAQAHPSKYMFLLATLPVDETKTMADVAESATPTIGGYARQQIAAANWAVPTGDLGDMMTSSGEKTFGPNTSSDWSVAGVGITTASTGTGGLFLAYVSTPALDVPSTVAFSYTLEWKVR